MRESRRTFTAMRARALSRRRFVFGALIAAFSVTVVFSGGIATADSGTVAIANAGVLGSVVTALKGSVPGVTITNTTGGSVALAQGIAAGTQPADLFGSADASVNGYLLGSANNNKERWFAALGRNQIVVQYSPSPSDPHATDFAKAAAGQEPWYQPLITGPAINLCRTSPDADPSGYYTLFVMQLAEKLYPKVATQLKAVLGDDRNPVQTSLTCATGKSVGAGTLDVSFTYLSGAIGTTGTPFLRLPAAINLGDQSQAANYATASFTNSAGQTFHGGVIRPSIAPIANSTNPSSSDAVLAYVFQNQGKLLWFTFGFTPSPLYAGGDPAAIPPDLRQYFDLRTLQVTVAAANDACSKGRLQVSGAGVTVIGAKPQSGGQCLVTVSAAALQSGMRDLRVLSADPSTTSGHIGISQTFAKEIDLSAAIPVVPSFLKPIGVPAAATK
jgi:ABC-type molybdate transport system substrate-binding protein